MAHLPALTQAEKPQWGEKKATVMKTEPGEFSPTSPKSAVANGQFCFLSDTGGGGKLLRKTADGCSSRSNGLTLSEGKQGSEATH